jgi:hypothetical protein
MYMMIIMLKREVKLLMLQKKKQSKERIGYWIH